MKTKTKVYFRRYKNENREVIAVFPDLIADNDRNLTCYQHIGQHGAVSPQFIIESTLKATIQEQDVKELINELTNIGYNLAL